MLFYLLGRGGAHFDMGGLFIVGFFLLGGVEEGGGAF